MSWLISKALMNSLCLQEQEEASLEEKSLDGEQSVQLNGSSTPQAYCAPDKMTGFSRLSRFGMTYKPLTETRGEELLTLYLAAFHVRTFPSQGEAQGLMEKVPQCGITWRGWSAKFDPDSYSWKTAQCSFIEESGECLETFPASGMTRGGLLWEQTRSERPTKGIERGLWRTPDTGGGGHLDFSNKARIIERMVSPSKSDWSIK
jgi:DNA (cytosine-5)-methyltransferase 1